MVARRLIASLLSRAVQVSLLVVLAPTISAAQSGDALTACWNAIGKQSARHEGVLLSLTRQCLKHGEFKACFESSTLSRSAAESHLEGAFWDRYVDTSCAIALAAGASIADIVPPQCPATWGRCAGTCAFSGGEACESLVDGGRCAVCAGAGRHDRVTAELTLPERRPSTAAELKCMSTLAGEYARIVRKGIQRVTACTKGKLPPFACAPPSAASDSSYARLFPKLRAKASVCEAAPGAELLDGVQRVCHRSVRDADDLSQCIRRLAECHICRFANDVFDQSFDCPALTGDRNCTGARAPTGRVYVGSSSAPGFTMYDADLSFAVSDFATSSFGTAEAPAALAAVRATNTLIAANASGASATLFDATSGRPVSGSLLSSTVATGAGASAIAVHPLEDMAYVLNTAEDSVTFIGAYDGKYVYGTVEASTFQTGPRPVAAVVDPARDVLYVANADEDTVTMFDALTGAYTAGSRFASTFPVGDDPVGLALDTRNGVLFVATADSVSQYDAATGTPLFGGTLAGATLAAGAQVGGVALGSTDSDPAELLVAAPSGTVTALDALNALDPTAPDYLYALRETSTYEFGHGIAAVAMASDSESYYVTSTDGDLVTRAAAPRLEFLSSSTDDHHDISGSSLLVNPDKGLAYIYPEYNYYRPSCKIGIQSTETGALIAETDDVQTLRSVSVDPSRNRLYLFGGDLSHGCYVALANAETGEFLGAGFEEASKPLSRQPGGKSLANPTAGRVYFGYDKTSGYPAEYSIAMLDAETAEPVNGTIENSSAPFTEGGTVNMALDESGGVLYVSIQAGDPHYRIVALDALTLDYVGGSLEAATVIENLYSPLFTVDETTGRVWLFQNSDPIVTVIDPTTKAVSRYTAADLGIIAGPLVQTSHLWSAALDPVSRRLYLSTLWYQPEGRYMSVLSIHDLDTLQPVGGRLGQSLVRGPWNSDIYLDPVRDRVLMFWPWSYGPKIAVPSTRAYLSHRLNVLAEQTALPDPGPIAVMP